MDDVYNCWSCTYNQMPTSMSSRDDAQVSGARKLTLRMDGVLIKRAKQYARGRGTSLSQMIADYFRAITVDTGDAESVADWKQDLPPTTRSLVGVAAGSELDEEDYFRSLVEKHR